ncbi:MAG: SDR family NAD(P)-dependent oxidoreductase [Alistipes sp.]|jgi:short-subunit dehydrogenase|nr:SDR family NAD(P)-dependent oxidoreductase [Alistipes sp.]
MLLKDKIKRAIIIGASSGIGRALAEELARDGYRVGITGRRAEQLAALAATAALSAGADLPESFVTGVFDATAEDAPAGLEKLIATLGGVELFVFCAGTGDLNPQLNYAVESHANRLNVDAFTRLCGVAYNHLQAAGGGHIAVVTSVMGLRGSDAAPAYSASKAYQINYLEGLRRKSAKGGHGITVTDLRPGSVDTAMMKGEGHFWVATPERAARVIARTIRRKRSVQYVTPRWAVVGWLLKRLPRAIYDKI